MKYKQEDYTIEELKEHIINRIKDPYNNPLSVTRAHEAIFGTLIPRSVGEAVSYTHLTLPTICSV